MQESHVKFCVNERDKHGLSGSSPHESRITFRALQSPHCLNSQRPPHPHCEHSDSAWSATCPTCLTCVTSALSTMNNLRRYLTWLQSKFLKMTKYVIPYSDLYKYLLQKGYNFVLGFFRTETLWNYVFMICSLLKD